MIASGSILRNDDWVFYKRPVGVTVAPGPTGEIRDQRFLLRCLLKGTAVISFFQGNGDGDDVLRCSRRRSPARGAEQGGGVRVGDRKKKGKKNRRKIDVPRSRTTNERDEPQARKSRQHRLSDGAVVATATAAISR